MQNFSSLAFEETIHGAKILSEINRKLPVATEIGSIFLFSTKVTGRLKKCKMINYYQHEISDR
jgi:hypothetical protein